MNCVESRRGVRLTPPPSRLRVTIFSRRLLRLKYSQFLFCWQITVNLFRFTPRVYQDKSEIIFQMLPTFNYICLVTTRHCSFKIPVWLFNRRTDVPLYSTLTFSSPILKLFKLLRVICDYFLLAYPLKLSNNYFHEIKVSDVSPALARVVYICFGYLDGGGAMGYRPNFQILSLFQIDPKKQYLTSYLRPTAYRHGTLNQASRNTCFCKHANKRTVVVTC